MSENNDLNFPQLTTERLVFEYIHKGCTYTIEQVVEHTDKGRETSAALTRKDPLGVVCNYNDNHEPEITVTKFFSFGSAAMAFAFVQNRLFDKYAIGAKVTVENPDGKGGVRADTGTICINANRVDDAPYRIMFEDGSYGQYSEDKIKLVEDE